MAKLTKKSQYENISVSQIHEILKSKKFLEELWWDMLKDMKDKPTYKRIKDMVEQLISQAGDFCFNPNDDAEPIRRKTILAELSILAYTIDTVISRVLYKKLQIEFNSLIVHIIDELKNKEKTDGNGTLEQESAIPGKARKKRPRPAAKPIKKYYNEPSVSDDEESDISVGQLSLDSVSSVHTSELSSFDDEISVSSDEDSGKTKKKMSLKDANEKYLKGRFKEIYEIDKADKGRRKKINQSSKPVAQEKESSANESPSRKTLPLRVRKPNSKYSSEDIVCPSKSKKGRESANSSPQNNSATVTFSPDDPKQQRKRRRPKRFEDYDDDDEINNDSSAKDSNLCTDAATEDLSAIGAKKKTEELRHKSNSSQNPRVASEMAKSPSAFGSRDRTAFTLFSTKSQ